MIKENQTFEVQWSNRTKAYYESIGYTFTKNGDKFLVPAKDLIPSAKLHCILICDCCGKEYESLWCDRTARRKKRKEDLCRSCSIREQHRVAREESFQAKLDEAYKLCEDKGYAPITNDLEYDEKKRLVFRYMCPIHGEQKILLSNFNRGHGCYRCGRKSVSNKLLNSKDYVERLINSVNGNKLLNKEEYAGSRVHNLRILCGKCGKHEFVTSFSDFYNCGKNQCNSCSSVETSGERLVAEAIKDAGLTFIREKKFDDCRDIRALPFDFYIPDKNMVIEFDGPHHYMPVFGETHMLTTQAHDKIKDEYCERNGIKILRIPYWDSHNIKNILQNEFVA